MSELKFITTSLATVWSDRIVTCLALIHNVTIFAYILRLNLKSKELDSSHSYRTTLFLVTIFSLSSNIFYNFSTLMMTTATPSMSCNLWCMLTNTGFVGTRFFFWYFSLTRLRIVFMGSVLHYSDRFFRWFYVSIIGAVAFLIAYVGVYQIYFENGGARVYQSGYNSCIGVLPLSSAGILGIVELAINVACFWCFYRRIKVLSAVKDRDLLYFTRKNAVLIFATVLSTQILMLFAVFTDLVWTASSVDSMINFWCLVLFDARLDAVYRKICVCMVKQDKATENQRNIAIHTAHRSNETAANSTADLRATSINTLNLPPEISTNVPSRTATESVITSDDPNVIIHKL